MTGGEVGGRRMEKRRGLNGSVLLPGKFEARRVDLGMQLIKNTCNAKCPRHFDPSAFPGPTCSS